VVVGAVAVLVATLVIWALLGWAVLVGCAAAGGRLPGSAGRLGRRLLRAVTPVALRRVVIAAAGLSLAAGLGACGSSGAAPGAVITAASAGASPTAAADPAGTAHADQFVDLDWPLGLVDAPAAEPSPPGRTQGVDPQPVVPPAEIALPQEPGTRMTEVTATPLPRQHAEMRAGPPDGTVVVLRGDSLWSIAAAHLPDGASTSQIDASWRAWYAVNRDLIGADPNLILPGQRLVPPTAIAARTVSAAGDGAP
jgi:hypothetical protein